MQSCLNHFSQYVPLTESHRSFADSYDKLDDPSLLHEASLLNGEWMQSKNGRVFDVEGKPLSHQPSKVARS